MKILTAARRSLTLRAAITVASLAAALGSSTLAADHAAAAEARDHPGEHHVIAATQEQSSDLGWSAEIAYTRNGQLFRQLHLADDTDSSEYLDASVQNGTPTTTAESLRKVVPGGDQDGTDKEVAASRLLGVERAVYEEVRGPDTGVEWGAGFGNYSQFLALLAFQPVSFPFLCSTVTSLPPYTAGQPYEFSCELIDVAVGAGGNFVEPKRKDRDKADPFPGRTTTYSFATDADGVVTTASIATVLDKPGPDGMRDEIRLDFTYTYAVNDPALPAASTILAEDDYQALQQAVFTDAALEKVAGVANRKLAKKQGSWTVSKVQDLLSKPAASLRGVTTLGGDIVGIAVPDPWRGEDARIAWRITRGVATRVL